MQCLHGVRSKKQATADAAGAYLPQDVLAHILIGLPASDLRRFRRVCKEWHDVISNPTFVDAHMVQGQRAPTHTVVLFPRLNREDGAPEQCNGWGFLFDEHWRLAAKFTAGASADMVGTCNGQLCFLDAGQGTINIVEPFTGESLTQPLPPETARRHDPCTYCFGFDATARHYKIVHQGHDAHPRARETAEQELYVYTVGGGKDWARVHVACAVHGVSYGDPMCVDGAMYWCSHEVRGFDNLARFDLATEEITSVERRWANAPGQGRRLFCRQMESGWHGELEAWCLREGGRWLRSHFVKLLQGRRLPQPHALQRGHLLLHDDEDGGLYRSG